MSDATLNFRNKYIELEDNIFLDYKVTNFFWTVFGG